MNILLAAATILEIQPFLNKYRENKFKNLDILVTGPGLLAATYHLSIQTRLKRPHLVIQAGFAGSFTHELSPGSLVSIKKDRVADEGAWEKGKFISLFDIALRKKNEFPFRNEWLVNPHKDLLKSAGIRTVTGISVNLISTLPAQVNHFSTKYKPEVESMEGAALHYVCLMENIPFLQIRSISNHIGERNKKKWKMNQAAEVLSGKLQELINIINQ